MKNQAEETAHAIALDIARRIFNTESNFTKKLEKLENRTRIIPVLVETTFGGARSASSIASDDYAVMNG